MDKAMYLKEPLDKYMIDSGADLTRGLLKAGLNIKASFWFYMPDSQMWRLIIATPTLSREGPRKIYQIIQKVISTLPNETSKVSLENVAVVETNHLLVKLLGSVIRTSGPQLANIRFANNTVNGQHIDDALIYLMK
jgi:hypothetical protein